MKTAFWAVPISRLTLGTVALFTCASGDVPETAVAKTRRGDAAATHTPIDLWADCRAPGHEINPMIYGVAYYPLTDKKDGYVFGLSPTARRWGGNHTSRYNWRLGNAWNTAADYFFRNVNYTGDPSFSWRNFLDAQRTRGLATALTVPMIGWVAKDTRSSSFPVSVFGPQAQVDEWHPDAGNGVDRSGKPLKSGAPQIASTKMSPNEIEAWVREIRAHDKKHGKRHVDLYLLDNEPGLWHSTHRDVHPEPVGYDELLERTVAYASAVRRADPEAKIAGPAAWGWWEYFFSAKDAEAGFWRKPDRRAHGDVPLLAWYLRELKKHEQRTGTRLLDVLNVHFYPQDIPKGRSDLAAQSRRLRATRALWDPSYKDESWIDDVVELLPRLSRLVAENYPGLGIMIGEYNFGGEEDMSGALALAEALGRFGAQPGMTAAFYWTYPKDGSPAAHAFRAFRNYDGKGGHFLERSVVARGDKQASFFVSRSATHDKVVAVALNLSQAATYDAAIAFKGCGVVSATKVLRYDGGPNGIAPVLASAYTRSGEALSLVLPPYSLTVLELDIGKVAER